MNREQVTSTEQSWLITADAAWSLRHLGLVVGKSSQNQVSSLPAYGTNLNDVGTRESGGDIDCGSEAPPPLRYGATEFAFQDLPPRKGPRARDSIWADSYSVQRTR